MTLLNTLSEKESPKVNIASVANPSDVNYFNNIINGIDNAVVTNSNAPEVFLLTSQFLHPSGRGSVDRDFIFGKMRRTSFLDNFLNSLLAALLMTTR